MSIMENGHDKKTCLFCGEDFESLDLNEDYCCKECDNTDHEPEYSQE